MTGTRSRRIRDGEARGLHGLHASPAVRHRRNGEANPSCRSWLPERYALALGSPHGCARPRRRRGDGRHRGGAGQRRPRAAGPRRARVAARAQLLSRRRPRRRSAVAGNRRGPRADGDRAGRGLGSGAPAVGALTRHRPRRDRADARGSLLPHGGAAARSRAAGRRNGELAGDGAAPGLQDQRAGSSCRRVGPARGAQAVADDRAAGRRRVAGAALHSRPAPRPDRSWRGPGGGVPRCGAGGRAAAALRDGAADAAAGRSQPCRAARSGGDRRPRGADSGAGQQLPSLDQPFVGGGRGGRTTEGRPLDRPTTAAASTRWWHARTRRACGSASTR